MKIPNYRFMAHSTKCIAVSAALMVLILVASLVIGVQLHIQFSGGAIITYSYEGEVDAAAFAGTAGELTGAAVSVQLSTDLATGMETIVLSLPAGDSLTTDQLATLDEGLYAAFPEAGLQVEEVNNVSAQMGSEFLMKCLIAVAFAAILMIVFVAFRFKRIGGMSAGVTAVIALVHNIIIVFGVHVFFGIPISGPFIAAVLTVLGYSINDTIVIFDRIRENKRLFGDKKSLTELVDRSMNQSLRRSINTTTTTVACMVIVAIVASFYNVGTIVTFVVPMSVGLMAGAYSSIFIAGPLWVRWQERSKAVA
ncbi:MAG: protein translocase subunit SecF [Oscillospiraceae bacterium]|nr:protein translocase subunit SecF [Oscillospiraceae bacterium]